MELLWRVFLLASDLEPDLGLRVGTFRRSEPDIQDRGGFPFNFRSTTTGISAEGVVSLADSVLAIRQDSRESSEIANELHHALNDIAAHVGSPYSPVDIEIRPVFDHGPFLSEVTESAIVNSVTYRIPRPNPWDEDEDFQHPVGETIDAMGGQHAEVSIAAKEGLSLDRRRLSAAVSAISATGGTASAVVRKTAESEPITINGGSEVLSVDVADDESWSDTLLRILKTLAEYRNGTRKSQG